MVLYRLLTREDEFRELYRSYWRLAGLTDELWRTALVFTKSTSVKTGGQAPPLPNASYATAIYTKLVISSVIGCGSVKQIYLSTRMANH